MYGKKLLFTLMLLLVALPAIPQITVEQIEYYIDSDPGHGNGIPITISPDTVVTFSQPINFSDYSPGVHGIYVRSKNSAGEWSKEKSMVTFIRAPFIDDQQLENIVKLEYYIDSDPGHGNGTEISVEPENMLTFTLPNPIDPLEAGVHSIYVRALNSAGEWSKEKSMVTFVRTPFVDNQQLEDIVKVEYYIDVDPGHGNGIEISIPTDDFITFSLPKDMSDHGQGVHTIFARAQNSTGQWAKEKRIISFIRKPHPTGADITYLDFYFNDDVNNGIPITITPDTTITFSHYANTDSLPMGENTFTLRSYSELGWGEPKSRTFRIEGSYALEFDGVDDYAQVNNLGNFGGYTVEFWRKSMGNSSTNYPRMVTSWDDAGSGSGFVIEHTGRDQNTIAIHVFINNTGGLITQFNIPSYEWHHIALTFDGNTAKIFLDGAIVATQNDYPPEIITTLDHIQIGGDAHFENRFFNGLIDEFRVWDYARTQEEIHESMHTYINDNSEGLVGYWRLNEGEGQTFYNLSGDGNHGQLGSSPAIDNNDPTWSETYWPYGDAQPGDIIYVDGDAPGNNNGTTWQNAFTDLQSALTIADSGQQIWVAAGTYKPSLLIDQEIPRSEAFQLINGVGIFGGFASTETELSQRDWVNNITILSGDIGAPDDITDNCYHIFYHPEGTNLDSTTVLDGFTIAGGNANGGGINLSGGGMYNDHNSPTIINCTFDNNHTGDGGDGGAIYNVSSSPTITNCLFSNNSAPDYFSSGGAIHNDASSPKINNCIFSGNLSDSGGGIFNHNSSTPVITDCHFTDNSVLYRGGGIFDLGNSSTVINCIFTNNSGPEGSGMCLFNASSSVINCLFNENTGNTLYNNNSTTTFTNCTFSNNTSYTAYNYDSAPTFANSILWGNTSPMIFNDISTPTFSYCDIQGSGGSGGNWDNNLGDDLGNNIDLNPNFVLPVNPDNAPTAACDLRLRFGSPCINTGSNASLSSDITDLDNDNDTIEPLPFDLAGNSRIQSDIVDMGAYEGEFLESGGSVLFVKWDAQGNNSGIDWQNAFTNLQSALAIADSGQQIWVAQGTYNPTNDTDRNATFLLPMGVYLFGGFSGAPGTEGDFSPRNIHQYETILSGEIGSALAVDNSYHIVTASNIDYTTLLHGFTIQGGRANGIVGENTGAGMIIDSSSVIINLCTFKDNIALQGGAVYTSSGNPTFTSCNFEDNSSQGDGGAIRSLNGDFTVNGCTFTSNSANDGGGGISSNGGMPIIFSNTFSNNSADYGGAVSNTYSSNSPIIINNTFAGNMATEGGAIYNWHSSPNVTNCAFSGNKATGLNSAYGGAIFNYEYSNPNIVNCTFGNNMALGADPEQTSGHSIFNSNSSIPTIYNSIFWNDADYVPDQDWWHIYNLDSPAIVNYCVVQDSYPNDNIINSDPRFINSTGDDGAVGTSDDNLTLKAISPAKDAGDTNFIPADILDLDGDGITNERISVDLLGNTRIAGASVDLGAYETSGFYILPQLVNFQSMPVQGVNPETRNVYISNNTGYSISISSAEFSSSHFYVVSYPNEEIGPGSSATIEIAFLPQESGMLADTLWIYHNLYNTPVKKVRVIGFGIPGVSTWEDNYPLWVINDGGRLPKGKGTENLAIATLYGAEPGDEYYYQAHLYKKDSVGNITHGYCGFTYNFTTNEWLSPQDTTGLPVVTATSDTTRFFVVFKSDKTTMPDSIVGSDWLFSINISPVLSDNLDFSDDLDLPITVGSPSPTVPPAFRMGWLKTFLNDQYSDESRAFRRRVATASASPANAMYFTEPNNIEDGNDESNTGYIKFALQAKSGFSIAFRDTTNETLVEVTDSTYTVTPADTTEAGSVIFAGALKIGDFDKIMVSPGETFQVPVFLVNPIRSLDTLGFRLEHNSVFTLEQIMKADRIQHLKLETFTESDTLKVVIKDTTGVGAIMPGITPILYLTFNVSQSAPLGERLPLHMAQTWARAVSFGRSPAERVIIHRSHGEVFIVSDVSGDFLTTPVDTIRLMLPSGGTGKLTDLSIINISDAAQIFTISADQDWIVPNKDVVTIESCQQKGFAADLDVSSFDAGDHTSGNINITGTYLTKIIQVDLEIIGYKYDFTYDGNVTFEDIQRMIDRFSKVYQSNFDLNNDGIIDKNDVKILIRHWGEPEEE